MERSKRSIRRFAKPVAAVVAGTVALFAAIPPAGDFVSNAVSSVKDVVAPPSRTEKVVERTVAETKTLMPWERTPTVYAGSVELFKKRFPQLDPERTHRVSIFAPQVETDIPTLEARAPQADGGLIAVRARFGGGSQVASYGSVTSWALVLYERRRDSAVVLCRTPFPTRRPPAFREGDAVYAVGVLLADGAIHRADGAGLVRVLYMVCSGVARITTFKMSVRRDRHGGRVGVLSVGR
jgi:hypothetical protein